MDPLAKEILTFWFATTDLSTDLEKRAVWFRSTPEFDARLIAQFTGVHEQAASGALDHFKDSAEECLALIVSLDQFPRNIFRGTARAFATDPRARDLARHAVDQGYDKYLSRWPKTFCYLPFEHSEELADQERGLVLYKGLDSEESLKSAIGHHEAIKRFGRFPHRNDVMGRQNTPEEEEYLKDPPLWGKTAAEIEALEKRKAAGDAE
ncbi:MAG: DUF924 domain-containing protein [Proteobacteria bacterium]|nr:DUF924 domain-containing protein [Pseudomonadota bacterium]